MQARSILSEEQRHALEATYIFIKAAVIHLGAYSYACRGADERQVLSLVDLGYLCQSKLLEQFPEVREFATPKPDASDGGAK